MPTTNEFNRRSYLKLAGLSVGGAVTGAQTGVVSAATDVEPSGYGLGGYGLGEYGTPSVDGSVAVSTGSATEIGQTSATLGGTVTDLGGADSVGVVFEWGTASSDQQRTTSRQQVSGPGDVTATVDELTPGTTYAFRLVATDTNGNSDTGTERQFTTRTATAGLGDESTLLPQDGKLVNAPYESEHDGYTGDGFVNFRESDSYVQWDVTTDTSAEFDLTIRYALGADDRTGLLTAGETRREISVASTGGWTNWETITERVSLPEGGSTIRIEAIGEDFGNVDAVDLSPVATDTSPNETPDETPESPTSKTLLPRDGDLGNALYQSEHEGYTGDGFVNFRASNSYVQWDVDSATTTDYDLTIRYALGAGDRTGHLTAGSSQQAVTVPSTGGWANWETTTQRVTLPEGSSTLRIEATGEDFGNVDAVTLTPREETADEGWTSMQLLPQDGELGNSLYESEHDGYTDEGYINFRASDSYVQWNVDTDGAAEFDLTIRYALGAADRTGLLTTGGSQREITVASTDAWTTWETTTERITLPEGSSTLRIEATGEDFGNVDAVELERVE